MADIRITTAGDTRVTTASDTRVTTTSGTTTAFPTVYYAQQRAR